MSTGYELVSRFRALASVHPGSAFFSVNSYDDSKLRNWSAPGAVWEAQSKPFTDTGAHQSPLPACGTADTGQLEIDVPPGDAPADVDDDLCTALFCPSDYHHFNTGFLIRGQNFQAQCGIFRLERWPDTATVTGRPGSKLDWNHIYVGTTIRNSPDANWMVGVPIRNFDRWMIIVMHVGHGIWYREVGENTWQSAPVVGLDGGPWSAPNPVPWIGTSPAHSMSLGRDLGPSKGAVSTGLYLIDAQPGMAEVVKGIWDMHGA